ALASLPAIEKGRRQLLIYVGDGALPPGHASPADVQKSLAPALTKAGAGLCSVLMESDPRGKLVMDQLAALSGGLSFRMGTGEAPQESIDWIAAGCPMPPKIVAVKAE